MSQQGSRSSQEKSFHDKAVADIAKIKFPFPTKDKPNWKTYLNEPNQTKGINMNGSTIYPDIVVVDTQNSAAMIGEVETQSSVNQNEVEQWKEYSRHQQKEVHQESSFRDNSRDRDCGFFEGSASRGDYISRHP